MPTLNVVFSTQAPATATAAVKLKTIVTLNYFAIL
jgi:hypothetical protein